jgi:hypothetical protein
VLRPLQGGTERHQLAQDGAILDRLTAAGAGGTNFIGFDSAAAAIVADALFGEMVEFKVADMTLQGLRYILQRGIAADNLLPCARNLAEGAELQDTAWRPLIERS